MIDISEELELVRVFNDTFLVDQHDSLATGNYISRVLRLKLFKEELGELFLAIYDNNKVEQLDAVIDMAYILFGTVNYHGMNEIFVNLLNGEKTNISTPIVNYPVEITTLLNIGNFERRYECGSVTFREVSLWLIELATSVLSLYSKLESDGIVKPGTFKEAFLEVHESNMSKLDENGNPIFREDGKVLKGKNYFKPNLEQFIL